MGGSTFSTFWTGQTGPYQRLCLASWVAHGFNAVVYTTNLDIELPKDVEKRPAEEILDLGGRVYLFKTGVGQGSPALHSDLFRYKLLLRGGWWLDTDVIVRSDRVPEQDIFVAQQADQTLGTAVMRFPADFALTHEAVAESLRLIENAKWTDIGPRLITRLFEKHGLKDKVADYRTAYAVNYTEALKFFDPAARDEIEERVGSSAFVHLWNQIWTIVGFPPDFGPPEGSYLDALFKTYVGKSPFQARAPLASIKTWWQNSDRVGQLEHQLRQAQAKIDAFPIITFRGS